MRTRIALVAVSLGALFSAAVFAANDGELWEVTSQMNIPGMPAGMAGMGQAPQRVCREKGQRSESRPEQKDCKIVDQKESGTRMTMTMSCPDGQMTVDMNYNAARTEYTGTIKMTGKRGDMTINTSGRKVGNCDPQQAKQEREAKVAKMKSQNEAQIAAMNRQQAQQQEKAAAEQTKACNDAASGMDAAKFPACLQPSNPMAKSASCTEPKLMEYTYPAAARTACGAKKAEYCKNLQTEAGFSRAVAADRRSHADGTEICGLQKVKLQASLCSGALKNESLEFLSRHCPTEVKQAGARLCPKAVQTEAWHFVASNCPADAKAVFAKNCAGRDYTNLQDRKQRAMCTTLARLDDEDARPAAAASPAAKAPEAKKATATQQMEQSVGKGLDKLRGLFGR